MRKDTITIEGVALTNDEAREVVEWVDDPLRPMPSTLYLLMGLPEAGTYLHAPHACRVRLTPALVDQLRDHVTPWRGSLWGDIHAGSRVWARGYEGTLCDDRSGCDSYLLATDDGQIIHCDDSDPVLVRRPRRPALTLGQVEPGQRFRFALSEGYVHRRTVHGWLEEATWMHATADDLHLTMPVRIVEDES